jgi:hypothetical protein
MAVSQIGIDMTWARAAFQPSSVKIIGMKEDMEAAVMSQQKNIRVLPKLDWEGAY